MRRKEGERASGNQGRRGRGALQRAGIGKGGLDEAKRLEDPLSEQVGDPGDGGFLRRS